MQDRLKDDLIHSLPVLPMPSYLASAKSFCTNSATEMMSALPTDSRLLAIHLCRKLVPRVLMPNKGADWIRFR